MGEVSRLLGRGQNLSGTDADVQRVRESSRRRRLAVLFALVFIPDLYLWYRYADGRPFNPFTLPFEWDPVQYLPIIMLAMLMVVLMLPYLVAGRSPHVLYRPEQIPIGLDDVKGLETVKDEAVRTLRLFLGYATFRNELGGNPRRGILFEGPPGTGKTHLAKALARHAGVPFLFVSAPAFQSMWYGMTARKVRKFFKVLKKTARSEGGAIGFIEEIDAIATRRGGMDAATPTTISGAVARNATINRSQDSGTAGIVNEFLIQLQSFDEPSGGQRFVWRMLDLVNLLLPSTRQIRKPQTDYSNVLVIAATNRGDMLDPALLRPGRFDKRLYFDLPSRAGRRELIDYYLEKKRHVPDLDREDLRHDLAGMTFGYTPVMIEHLLDEALVNALRDNRSAMTWHDVTEAKLTAEIGLAHHVAYTAEERRSIATHEAGHAAAAYLVGEGRKLEVLSIVKRREALGLLSHTETEERFTKTRTEMIALMQIALAGMASEEIFFGESGTGPAGDLSYATKLAAEMVGSLGMGGSLVSYRAVDSTVFDHDLVGRVLGNGETKKTVDRLLKREKRVIKELLEANRHLVVALRDALLEREELIGDQIISVLEAAGPRRRPPAPKPRSRRGPAGGTRPRRAGDGSSLVASGAVGDAPALVDLGDGAGVVSIEPPVIVVDEVVSRSTPRSGRRRAR